MIVTVQETIEHSRGITAEMFEAYLIRRGWVLGSISERNRWYQRKDSPCVAIPRDKRELWQDLARAQIETIALYVDRKPHEVLVDIAEGR